MPSVSNPYSIFPIFPPTDLANAIQKFNLAACTPLFLTLTDIEMTG